MRAINKQIIGLYILIAVYLMSRVLSIKISILTISNTLNVFLWLGIFLIAYFISKNNYRRFLDKSDKVQTTFIVVVSYLIIYFLLGLVFGYQYNAYSINLKGIINNTLLFMPIIIFQEYTRGVLVEYSGNNKKILTIITIMFILVTVNYNSLLSDFRTTEAGFKFICSDVIPNIARNVLFTYLAYISGPGSGMVYRVLTTAFAIYLPILPNLDWFYTGLAGIIVPAILFVLINYSHMGLVRTTTKEEEKNNKPSHYIPVFVFVFVVVGFVIGLFKYMPLAVVSNSMFPLFERGDVAVIEQIKQKDLKRVKVGTIIRYQADGYYVIHRVTKIEETEDGGLLFTTKGDNNNAEDANKVKPQQVLGIYKFKVKYIGFPSVWLSEALR